MTNKQRLLAGGAVLSVVLASAALAAPGRDDSGSPAETRAAAPALEELRRQQARLFEGAASLFEENAALIATLCAQDRTLAFCP
jgi:hypothetical protein